ncbi:hypothetical protein DBR32_07240 [Taibaiella sp. KBW10]|uniref:FKBP-type peptidyl-prolyl cis-trans isomerase n=1 Tax=Taibaiella sp. KBW10 TaxID=2153357 RepID=UPI000F5B4149|nr:FKBP-type peptidyl-prolyl cis-trans isomerase [Taibaiella sp. KBW10]RQO31733.1 hypothetical protein DBR32_07240 [Taibaiella sp. KBW10]
MSLQKINMFKRILVALLATTLLASCFKKDVCEAVTAKPSDDEIVALKAYVESVNPNAVFDPRGFYYEIVKAGSPNHPGICSDIYANFEGRPSDSEEYFVKTNNNSSAMYHDLSKYIYGWRYALPMIGMGGEMKLYLPPTLGKGNNTTLEPSYVPADKILVYSIKLIRYN